MGYAALGAVVLAGVVLIVARRDIAAAAEKTADAVEDVVTRKLNPVSHDNIFNRGVNSIGRAISGNQHWTLGTWIYDITH